MIAKLEVVNQIMVEYVVFLDNAAQNSCNQIIKEKSRTRFHEVIQCQSHIKLKCQVDEGLVLNHFNFMEPGPIETIKSSFTTPNENC